MTEENKKPLLGMTLADLKQAVGELGLPAYSARQIADWVYAKKVDDIDRLSNISAKGQS